MSQTSSRLFLALMPSAAAIAELSQALTRVRKGLSDVEGMDALRWLPSERWHVTVLFVGPVEGDRVDSVAEACASTIGRVDVFSWYLTGCQALPSSSTPRVVWSPVHSTGDSLVRLHRWTRQAVVATGHTVERQRYRPHLTLARVRDRTSDARGATRRAVAALEGFRSTPTEATTALLLQSHQGPAPRYEELGRWSFSG